MSATHNATTEPLAVPGAGPQLLHVPVLSIARSLRNPRKHFDQVKLQDLADSIKATGVHQPILLRPLPEHRIADEQAWAKAEKRERAQYELVAGERRWRACKLAGLTEIPAMIRPMTDHQALEAAVIENLQREDVTALEEAEGYQELMTTSGMTADQVGTKIGKSRAYVYARLKILDLCEEVREALRVGELDYSCALPIARIATAELQREALEWAIEPDYDDEKPSARAVQAHVKKHFMLDLRKAPFSRKDADLCPSAGACMACPHRTGADLEDDDKSADVCTNPPCYQNKQQAHADQMRKQAQERGCEVLDERQSKQLIGSFYSEFSGVPGFKRLDSAHDCPISGKTLRKVVGVKVMEQSGIKPTMVTNPNNPQELIACVTPEQAEQLLQMAGHAEAQEKLATEAQENDKRNEKEAQEKAEEDCERAWRLDVLQSIVTRLHTEEKHTCLPALPMFKASCRLAAKRLAGQINGDDAKLLCKLLGLGKVVPKDAIKQAADEWTNPELLAGCLIALHDRAFYSRWDHETNDWAISGNPQLMAMAEACGVDVDAAKAKAQANIRAAQVEKAASIPVETAAPKVDLPLTPAARTGGSGAKGKAKKSPAAPASSTVKTTAAEALAGIAAAMQAADATAGEPEPGAAVAAQGDEGAPVADAQAPIPGAAAAAQGNDAGPVAAGAAQDLPPSSTAVEVDQVEAPSTQQSAPAQTASADDGQARTDAGTGAADEAAASQRTFASSDLVRVKQGLKGSTGRPRKDCGRVGVVRQVTPISILVEFGPGASQRAGFDADELEPYMADPVVGKRVRILAPFTPCHWQEGTVLAVLADGWQVELPSKRGTAAKTLTFETTELESIP